MQSGITLPLRMRRQSSPADCAARMEGHRASRLYMTMEHLFCNLSCRWLCMPSAIFDSPTNGLVSSQKLEEAALEAGPEAGPEV